MCSGPKKHSPTPPSLADPSILLELAASDDLSSLRRLSENHLPSLSFSSLWYGPSSASPTIHVAMEQRTPLMIASLYGSTSVVSFIVASFPSEATRASSTDGVTALHLAAFGGAATATDIISLLISAGADVESLDSSGRRPGDLIPRILPHTLDKSLRALLKAASASPPSTPPKKVLTREDSKKEYPPDLTLPDIKTGIYSTDEFRMYAFKIKPCSRAYSHDWTECPFVHPGENARRRDPRKFFYSCVPCPDFRKGTCRKADNCEYAHGVFESWLHPAQYRTRLCKDEVGCKRRICFFAHKPEELRSVNPSAISVGSGGSPRAGSNLDMATALLMMHQNRPGSPIASSPMPTRLNTPIGARDLDLDMDLLSLDQYTQKMFDMPNTPPQRGNWGAPNGNLSPGFDSFASVDAGLLSQLQAISLKQSVPESEFNPSQLFPGYESNLPSSPMTSQLNGSGLDHSMARAIMNSRANAFAKRSQSFCDRRSSPVARPSSLSVMTSAATSAAVTPAVLSDWGSPSGKLDWGFQGEELQKLRKSASFGIRSNQTMPVKQLSREEPDLAWPAHGSVLYNTDLFGPWPEQEPTAA
ncbi:zinc finger CCCH domain-containing protein 33-like protein [Carex littledalei]|uniref:Zinc finger CCCH domain-containing protein 33-like protein n=1 Tax=Carex littledalei TaxID=544730 RepID=A0A833QWN1_9POAL|nr:zinc finger CCCH domain-containing protein 33-like protein [Carex littledalei]